MFQQGADPLVSTRAPPSENRGIFPYVTQEKSGDNTLRQSRACTPIVHNSHAVLKYELGKETKRDSFGRKGTHLFSRSIYLFIN